MNHANLIYLLHLASRRKYIVEETHLGQICDYLHQYESQLQDPLLGKAFSALRIQYTSPNAQRLALLYIKCLKRYNTLSPLTLSNACYILQWYDRNDNEYQQLVQHILRFIPNNKNVNTNEQQSNSTFSITNSNASSILSGFRNFGENPDEISLLETLTPIIREAKGELTHFEATDMFGGISSLSLLNFELFDIVTKKFLDLKFPLGNHMFNRYLMPIREINRRKSFLIPPLVIARLLPLLSEPIDAHNFTMIMSTFASFTSNQVEAHKLLRVLTDHILHNKRVKFDAECYVSALSGLRYMNSQIPEVELFLTALYQKMTQDDKKYRFLVKDMSFMISGFQSMSSDSRPVMQWMSYFTQRLVDSLQNNNIEICDLQSITRIMTGMRYMSSELPEIRSLIKLLNTKLQDISSIDQISFIQIAFSLQRKSTKYEEIQSFITTFRKKIENSSFEPICNTNDICKVVTGFEELNSHLHCTRKLLAAVVLKFSQLPSISRIDVYNLATVAYSLRSLDSRYQVVSNILEVLSLHLSITTHDGMRYGTFNKVDFLNSILGLRRLNSDIPAVQRWLDLLIPHLEATDFQSPFSTHELCSSMASLSHVANDQDSVRRLLIILIQQLKNAKGKLPLRSFAEAIFGMRRLYEYEDQDQLTDTLLLVLLSKIENTTDKLTEKNIVRICSQLCCFNAPKSASFQHLVTVLANLISNSHVKISSSSMSIILQGLRGLSSGRSSTRDLIIALTPKLKNCPTFSKEEFCLATSGLEKMNSTHECVRILFESLLDKCPADLWDDLTPSQAILLTAGMSSLNPFEFEATNKILLPLSQHRWKISVTRDDKVRIGRGIRGEEEEDDSQSDDGLFYHQAAVDAIDRMMSRKGLVDERVASQLGVLQSIQNLLVQLKYTDVLDCADMIDQCQVRGCVILKPLAMDIWETIRSTLDRQIRTTGAKNYYLPLLIPTSLLSMEASHIEGFAKECAVVTHHRLKSNPNYNATVDQPSDALIIDESAKLEEPLVIRPTSEAAMWTAFRKWIHSHRDLPLKVNQWANVVRWELRPRPFLRTSEFLWQEGHTAHATKEDAMKTTIQMLEIYERLCRDLLAVPVIKGVKSKHETFAGADQTYTIEGLMQNGWALQCGTSHFLGTNFSKAFDVSYQDQNGDLQSVWATSWGVSTRLIGALIMSHSDDIGLVLPPAVAPIQVVFIPIHTKKTNPQVVEKINQNLLSLIAALEGKGVRCHFDDRAHLRPGAKYYEWERKGVPLRVVLGERDFHSSSPLTPTPTSTPTSSSHWQNQMTLSIFDRILSEESKYVHSHDNHLSACNPFVFTIQDRLTKGQEILYQRASNRLISQSYKVTNYEEMKTNLTGRPGLYLVPWRENQENERRIKEDCHATIRCYPLEENKQPVAEGVKCFYSGEQATHWALFARAY